jgi:acetate kinase
MSENATILVVNAGSSSLKFALFDASGLERIGGGEIERIGHGARLRASRAGETVEKRALAADAGRPERSMRCWLAAAMPEAKPTITGHRVVHGGMEFVAPVRIDNAVLDRLEQLDPLAPLHQPTTSPRSAACVSTIRVLRRSPASTPRSMHIGPTAHGASRSRALHDAGVCRYGFHGLRTNTFQTNRAPRAAS